MGRPPHHRINVHVTLSPEALEELNEASERANLSRSRYVELLIYAQREKPAAFKGASGVDVRRAAEELPPAPKEWIR